MTNKAFHVGGAKGFFRTQSGEVHVLKNSDLTVRRSEFSSVVAPSGSGKTTLLWSASGLHKLDRGTVALGEDVTNIRQSDGLLGGFFQ